ncbi:MAG: hypothetical protein KGH60_05025 [Candidatus Micrarchaeota archaeon]|nr:hypothetical protein [Candidatus Micrarchaeota archaeon]
MRMSEKEREVVRHGLIIEADCGDDLRVKMDDKIKDCMQEGLGNTCYIRIVISGAKLPLDSQSGLRRFEDQERDIGSAWDSKREPEQYKKTFVGFYYGIYDTAMLKEYEKGEQKPGRCDYYNQNRMHGWLLRALGVEERPDHADEIRTELRKKLDDDVTAVTSSFLIDTERGQSGIYKYHEVYDMLKGGATAMLYVNVTTKERKDRVHEISVRARNVLRASSSMGSSPNDELRVPAHA